MMCADRWVCPPVLGLFVCTVGAAAVGADHAPGDAGRVVNRAYVPSPERRVGEVRLIERGGAVVVQTLLYSKVLKRVVAEIRAKEERNWPPERDGHADMQRYVAALEAARQEIWRRLPKDRTADRPQRLLIEFVAGDRAAEVALAEFDFVERHGAVEITARRPLATLDLSAPYVRRNMRLILQDAFGRPADEIAPAGMLPPEPP
jgi:hypothetical protein